MLLNKNAIYIFLGFSMILKSKGAPQFPAIQRALVQQTNELPSPYDFAYKVDSAPTGTFFGHNEAGDQSGRVVGTYYVYLPDGRLMNVDYTVEGDSGFVPRISFSNQRSPAAAAPLG